MFAALVAAVLAFLAFDWLLFVPPVHGFTVADPSEYAALATLLVTILVIGQLLAVARSRADESDSLQRQTQLLYDVSTAALSGPHMTDVYPMALWRLNEALGIVGSRLFLKEGAGVGQVAASGTVASGVEDIGRCWPVWGPEYEDQVPYLWPVITSLRNKLGSGLINTEPGVGYRLRMTLPQE